MNSTYKFKENIVDRSLGKTMSCYNDKFWNRKKETIATL